MLGPDRSSFVNKQLSFRYPARDRSLEQQVVVLDLLGVKNVDPAVILSNIV
jgi:hypothetical protein